MSERIFTRCPACGNDTLTINDGHLLCTWHTCPDPTLIDRPQQPAPREPVAGTGEQYEKQFGKGHPATVLHKLVIDPEWSDPQARQDTGELERIATHIKNRSALYSDPSYLQIKSPLAGEDLWIGQVIFAHHDGEVCEAQFDAPTIAELLPILWTYVKENYK